MSIPHLLVDAQGVIVGSCLWDGTSTWQPPKGLRAVPYSGVWRDGWRWDGKQAIDPNPPSLASVGAPPAPSPSSGIKAI